MEKISATIRISSGERDDMVAPVLTNLTDVVRAGRASVADAAEADALYDSLTRAWQAAPSMGYMEIVRSLREHTAANGTKPFAAIPSHTGVLSDMLARLKADGGADLPVYAEMEKAVLYAVASNGALTNFISSMRKLPEEPEGW